MNENLAKILQHTNHLKEIMAVNKYHTDLFLEREPGPEDEGAETQPALFTTM